ncbi:MAG: hypothetical protein ISR58_20835 [Anaerolineales bacterium]|nr:hypothetical protein [Chloroflexota bacterium]MBL6983636.1 hypothetical protein [Anaerolineales bacterium]
MSLLIKIFIFCGISAFIVWISRASLRDMRSHGFYRFFAWEAILAVMLINIDYWLVDPFNWQQIIAWVLLLISLLMIFQGIRFLRKGESDESRDDPALLGLALPFR